MLELQLNSDGTWNIVGIEPAQMAEFFILVDDEVKRFRHLHTCRSEGEHRRHANVVLLHSAITASAKENGLRLSTARSRATVDV